MKRMFAALYRAFSSYWLAITVLTLLLILTFVGTIEQVEHGLFQVQKKYFSSMIFWQPVGPVSIPLPGVYLLSIILSINLILGGLVRLWRKQAKIGMYIVHGGILFMLLAGLVTHHFAVEGSMMLAPNQSKSAFQSYHHWELVAMAHEEGARTEFVIPFEELNRLSPADTRTYTASTLPFDLTLSHYYRNATIQPKGPMFDAPTPVVGQFFVMPLELDKQNEINQPAVYLTLRDKTTGEERREILWGRSLQPLTIEMDDKLWTLALRRESTPLPFAIRLEEFRKDMHPGTQIAASYESDITKLEGGQEQAITIRMNEPLRHEGFTFFQSSYVEDPQTGITSSVFAVVRNPADQWPLWACVIITAGMLMHFGEKLLRHLRAQRAGQRHAAAVPAATPAPAPAMVMADEGADPTS